MDFAQEIAATIADHLDDWADGQHTGTDWDRDDGTIRITARTTHSITLGLFANDDNGEVTETELKRVTVMTQIHILPNQE